MSADGVKKFIAMVELHFPRPKFTGDETMEGAWVASMTRVLGTYPDDVLSSAAHSILTTRDPKSDGRFFPAPSECTEECERALRLKRSRETPLLSAPDKMPYEARVNLARDIMRAPAGQLAIREGWGQSMFHFIVNNGRAPGGKEVDGCRRAAKQFAADYERLLRDEHPFRHPLKNLAETMMSRFRERMEGAA